MTTASILLLSFLAIIGFAIINLFLWLLEFIAATAKCLLAYLLSKPYNWQRCYFDTRMLFTRMLLIFSFAMLSPRTMVKHQDLVKQFHAKKIHKSRQHQINKQANKHDF